jgi:hypothetical protein
MTGGIYDNLDKSDIVLETMLERSKESPEEKVRRCVMENRDKVSENIKDNITDVISVQKREEICNRLTREYILKELAKGRTLADISNELTEKYPNLSSRCFCDLCRSDPDPDFQKELNEKSEEELKRLLGI